MAPDDLLRRVPTAHLVALSLKAVGSPDEEIARFLDIEVEAVGPLIRLAQAKVEHAVDRPAPEHALHAEPMESNR